MTSLEDAEAAILARVETLAPKTAAAGLKTLAEIVGVLKHGPQGGTYNYTATDPKAGRRQTPGFAAGGGDRK